MRETNPVAEALIALLHLVDSRFEASRVLDLLALAPVRRKFGLSESDVERVADWVAQTGIAWARDEQQRRAMGQPAERIHTWRFGLDRLLLGVAMADEGDRVVDDVTPFDDMESDAVDLLSRLAAFYASLERICERLDEARSIEDWTDVLGDVLTVMTAVPRDEAWLEQQVRGRLSDIVDGSRDADGSASATQLALSAVRSLLEGTIDANPQFVGYETGAVTFCSMIPMRSTPHRVVCMIGMDDDAFPKTARAAGFDLLASAARVGDRSPRDEDRYLFLEAILSARDHLVITYTGRDVRTNEDKPPAVPVGELLDVIDRSVATEDGGPSTRARAQITTEHPLQAFSPRNFGVGPDGQPRPSLSYDAVQLQAARALQHGERTATEFFPEPLPAPEWDDVDAVPIIELDTLLRFYTNPTQWLLNNRLGIRLGEYGRETEDVEPVEAGGLAGWRMGSSRLDARLAGRDIERWAEATLARGDVPAGTLGRIEIDAVGDIVEELAGRVERVRVDEPESLPLDVTVHGVRIVGRVPDVHEDRILRWQYARMKPKHRLAQWIQLLVAVAAHPQRPLSSRLVARASKGSGAETQSIRMPGEAPAARRDRAVELLEPIVRFYREGQRVPLALFPQASEAYASALRGGAPTEKAVAKTRSKWEPNRYGPDGDRVDDHIGLVFGGMSIDDIASQTDFLSIATEIWGPLLEAEVVE